MKEAHTKDPFDVKDDQLLNFLHIVHFMNNTEYYYSTSFLLVIFNFWIARLQSVKPRTASGMDGPLTLIFVIAETIRNIKKLY